MKRLEIIPSIFSHHSSLKLEIYHKQKSGKNSKHLGTKRYTAEQPVGLRRNHKVTENK